MPRRRRRRRFHFLIGACAGACIALAAIVGAWALGLGPFAPVIGVPDAFADLTAMAEELSSSEGVIMALVEGPLLRQADAGADPNGWGDGGIEDDPSGNNWWAEAIGAYRAWEHADRFGPVAVGVIDDGFDLDHPDLDGAATLLSSHSGNEASDHGTADEAVAQLDRAGAFACEVVVVDEATGLSVEGAQATFSLADEARR